MKVRFYPLIILSLSAALVCACGKKKSTDPVAVLLDAATESLKIAKDGKAAAAAIETLVAAITPLKEKNPDLFKDRTPFADSDKAFIDAYGDTMVKYSADEDFAAAEKKLLPLGVLH